MENETISTLRKSATNGSEDALLILLDRFSPLLQKYARKFEYEDTLSELRLYFIHLIKYFPTTANTWNDSQTTSYIAKSIYTFYIKLSKQHTLHETKDLEFNPEIMDQLCNENTEQIIILKELFSHLTVLQKNILILHYMKGYSIQEIAQLYGKSRQAINKTKNQALTILQKQLNS